METNRIRQLWAENKPAIGLWVALADPGIVEIAAYAGYDFVAIDQEHCALDFQTIENMLRAAKAAGVASMVRVPENNMKAILRIVELGPDGVFIPHIHDSADAKKAVEAVRYRPFGDRGISGSTRAARYGLDGPDFPAFARRINQEVVVAAMIEDKSAVDDIEAIAATEGVDVCFIGPADLARSLDHMGARNDPATGVAIERVAAACRTIGKAKPGIAIYHPQFELTYGKAVRSGFRFMTHGTDARVLLGALQETLRRAKADV